jgi:hypothetical protein
VVLASISVSDVTVTEGDAGTVSATFTVTQSVRSKSTVHFATVNDSATSPGDYLARSGTIRFAGNRLSRSVTITVNGDTTDEDNETFFLELSQANGATIADGHGVGTINDDDPPPTVSVPSAVSVPEGNAGDAPFASIDVSLSAASSNVVSIHFTTVSGTAAAGSDYVAKSATLDLSPGQTQATVLVDVIGDDDDEGNETFDVTLSSPVNALLGNATETVTIVDNDPIPLGSAVLDISDATVREGQSGTTMLSFTVTRSGETTTAVDVDYATANGSASTPGDYGQTSGNLVFGANDTSETIDVTVNGDIALEHDEDLFVSLLNPSAGAAIQSGQGTGIITNDDTRTTVGVKKGSRTLKVHGRLSPARRGRHMAVKLFRKKHGVWARLATKRAILSGHTDLNGDGFTDSTYTTKFLRPKRGRCRVIARFPGDSRFGSSSAVRQFRC